MNRQVVYAIVLAVALVHLGLYYGLSHLRSSLPKPRPQPKSNFGVAEEVYTDSQTGEKIKYRELRVSTTLVDPAVLERIERERAARAATPVVPSAAATPEKTTP